MNFYNLNSVYFIGVGGIGMSAVARYFNSKGLSVEGYDKTETPLTNQLEKEGVKVHFEDDLSLVDMPLDLEKTLVVYTPAIPENHSELNELKSRGFNVVKRSEALGIITENAFSIGVAGTHGKTTTSSIVAHVLQDTGYGCNAFLGGIASNYNTNFLVSDKTDCTVVEADEYDRSFLTLSPNIAVITSMDADHLDIYGDKSHLVESFNLYADKLTDDGLLILRKGLELNSYPKNVITYSATEVADVYASNIRIENGDFVFDLNGKINQENIKLGLPGIHNIENALAAIITADYLKIELDKIWAALKSFKGVKRRFDVHVKNEKHVYIDDYAHHPTEIDACLKSVKTMFPSKKITGVFQPHLFSRTKDFVDEFADSLSVLDELILLDIYPARELPMEGVDSNWLASKIDIKNKVVCPLNKGLEEVKSKELEVLVTLGAGDIDTLVKPIKEFLENA